MSQLTVEGIRTILAMTVGKSRSEPLILKLFLNKTLPKKVRERDLEEPSNLSGYKPIKLNPVDWKVVGDNIVLPETVFVFSGGVGGEVYGYFAVQEHSGKVMFAERFEEGPFEPRAAGDNIRVRIELKWNTGK